MFKVTRSIRLLHINDSSELEVVPENIPENIRYLHHLRYLRFPISNGKLLPSSLSSLYHLQFLTTKTDWRQCNCCNDYFSRDMNNLSNLRYLSCERLNFPLLASLNYLQQVENLKYSFEDLEDMRDEKLTNLFLSWNHAESDIADSDLIIERRLDNLQPHNNLKKLWLFKYRGARPAKWMNEAHLINNLQEINLTRCLQLEFLPPFGQLPFLKTLWLSDMPKLNRLEKKFHGNDIFPVFRSLETLCFEHLEALVDWFDASIVDGLFPCLTKLYLYHCPNLQELPYLPPKLESLEIDITLGGRL